MRKVLRTLAAAATLALLAPSSLGAQSNFSEADNGRIHLELGGMFASFDTQAGLSATKSGLNVGAMLDFEQIFNVPVNKTTFRGDGWWRVGKKSRIDFGYDQFTREGQRTLTEDITWGDYTIKANALADGLVDVTNIWLGYRYDFWQEEHVRISGTIGIDYLNFKTSVSADGTVVKPDGTVLSGIRDAVFQVKAPVPLLGFQVDGAISRHFTAGIFFRAIAVNVDNVSGYVVWTGLGLRYYPLANFGIGTAVESESIRLKKYAKESYEAQATYAVNGLRFFVIAGF